MIVALSIPWMSSELMTLLEKPTQMLLSIERGGCVVESTLGRIDLQTRLLPLNVFCSRQCPMIPIAVHNQSSYELLSLVDKIPPLCLPV